MASSSSTIDSSDNYDVFLSFRGEDTRYNFTSHLHKALLDHNIKVFIDYNIRRGQEITLAIERVIEGAKMSIIVFSKNYAESTFCLDELLKIMECRESKAQIVLPIFYKVEPSEKIYQEAFTRHDQTIKQLIMMDRLKQFFWKTLNWVICCLVFESHEEETINQEMKVEKWKSAFHKALGLAGEPIDDKSNEAERIEKFTTEVLMTLKELNNSLSKGEERICTSLVGQTAENIFTKIWECLMNHRNSRVGVYGMGGVGKTTIATCINNQLLEVANSFTHIYWVTVSKDSSTYNLQSGIAQKINLDLSKEDDEKSRAAMIQKVLNNKKFLLILDDVWEAYELTKDVGLPTLVDGQKLLLTSRSRRVCERMECLPIEVKPLSEHEAQDLFVKESNYQINDSRELRDIMRCIVEECAGLPLAIVVIARRMRGVVEIREWRNTLRELQKPCEGENPEMDKVFKVLRFSYDRLFNDRCRQCFLYCSLFPEDHTFKGDDLIDYWIGERIIDEQDSRQAELDKGNVILGELIHSSLLESNESKKLIKMHDVIRDMARIIVEDGSQFQHRVQVPNKKMLKSFPNSAPHCSKLKSLVLQGNDIKELPGRFFANMQSLNVLHMTSIGVETISVSIANLGNLRVLIIDHCYKLVSILSWVGLEKLQHLKISWNHRLIEIPKGIERLVNLRVLDLSMNESLINYIPSDVLEKLSHLQTLDLNGSRVGMELETLFSLKKLEILRVEFYNLHKLNCYLKSGHWQRLLDYQINCGEPGSINWEKGMQLKAIRNVEELMGKSGIFLDEEWNGESGIFLPNNIQNLELIYWESRMFNVFKNPAFAYLQTIRISSYLSKYLFTVNLAQLILHNVQELYLDSCYKLEEIIATEEEWVNQSNYKNYPTILLPNLKKLLFYNLRELSSIYRGRMMCPSLELIHVYDCNKIRRLQFCIENEGNKQNAIILRIWNEELSLSRRWWDSLQWDDPNAKSMYNPIFSIKSESRSKHKDESEVDTENE